MTSVLDLWRAVDPAARLVSGSIDHLARPVRGIARTRAGASAPAGPARRGAPRRRHGDPDCGSLDAPPRRPPRVVADAGRRLARLQRRRSRVDPAGADLPVLFGAGSVVLDRGGAASAISRTRPSSSPPSRAELRLAGAEAALADPQPSAPAGVVAARLRRGVAVTVDGALRALNPRPAGRALATRFAAAHARLLADRSEASAEGLAARATASGCSSAPIGTGASAWLFDDLPLARIDEVGLDALAVTLRALLRRRAPEPSGARRMPKAPPSTGDPLRDTLLAVARANGRIAPAARALGVHRNTVLYRLRRAEAELGIDPRRAGRRPPAAARFRRSD